MVAPPRPTRSRRPPATGLSERVAEEQCRRRELTAPLAQGGSDTGAAASTRTDRKPALPRMTRAHLVHGFGLIGGLDATASQPPEPSQSGREP